MAAFKISDYYIWNDKNWENILLEKKLHERIKNKIREILIGFNYETIEITINRFTDVYDECYWVRYIREFNLYLYT